MKKRAVRVYPGLFELWLPYAFMQPQELPKLITARFRRRPPIVLNTLPKSGSMFLLKTLSKSLRMAICHIRVGHFPYQLLDPLKVKRLSRGGGITQAHFNPRRHNLLTLLYYGINKVVVHVRDPRQALVSWVFHLMDRGVNHPQIVGVDEIIPEKDYLAKPLEELISWHIEHYLPQQVKWMEGWLDISESPAWSDLQVFFTRFEDFKADQNRFLQEILDFYGIKQSAFRHKKEKPEKGKLHFRKGSTDEWRTLFTPSQIQRANELIPWRLIDRFGW